MDTAPEHFSGTADRLTAARILRDRIGTEGKLGPDPAAGQEEELDEGDMSAALTLLLRWSSTRSSSG